MDKHFFPETAANTLVPRHLRALAAAHPHLGLVEAERVVFDRRRDRGAVALVSGGGSGHEPGWAGYVGGGALAAAACGDIFASPSTKQVLAAVRAAPSDAGHILMITNYTGDKLHFGLAAERARAQGLARDVAMIHLADDVSIGRSRCGAVGRRGMPGHIVPMKITGAAAGRRYGFDQCVRIGRAVNDQVVSIGSALDHCHVPGRRGNEAIPKDVAIVGAGIHNEPGAQRLSPFPPVEELIRYCLRLLCDPADEERHFVTFLDDDAVVLVVNNYGGLSNLELGALTDETITQLAATWKIKPTRILTGAFETSLNAPGFSISLCNLSAASRESATPVAELLDLLDAPTAAVSWPNLTPPGDEKAPAPSQEEEASAGAKVSGGADLVVDPKLLDAVIRAGCEAAIAAEPNLTKWDTVLGDGDCGEAVKGVSEAIIKILDAGAASRGSVLDFLDATTDAVDDMGGTLGAILGILLSAFTHALRTGGAGGDTSPAPAQRMAAALAAAVAALKTHTGAREGDRTVMDVLLPFAAAFAGAGADFHGAVGVARDRAEATRHLRARFGRATYVAEAGGQALPDPGAWAVYEWLDGMSRALRGFEA